MDQDIRYVFVDTPVLSIAIEERGPEDGAPVVLLHGFPYDPRCFDEIAPRLAEEGYRVIAPYLRGYGATRFLNEDTMRSGQQAALAKDLLNLLDAMELPSAALMGFDWGGRAACIVAALWPERVRCLVTGGGYNVQDIATAGRPLSPAEEHGLWYQYYFQSERGRAGLEINRRDFCQLLWRLWSPTWSEGPTLFGVTAPSFDNPDFVDVVIHSYRHRFGLVPGDPNLEEIERQIALQPPIGVPTISLWGSDAGIRMAKPEDLEAVKFTGYYKRRVLAGVGHNIPGEAPDAVVQAILELLKPH
ncbi:alpha/beta hydrolase [Acidisoma cellulosilytica]|uniref:Alpha/beta hydrolase n=1 Tax=Acidisoma cellulosilyticum TaxID=2802395 RepID=A0A964E690_9PROT|nr:alpha/beta hydrolase [Acidisoma cellulosilyticum]MCB8883349.1 alpha/beta hydrolase [Acidisoma cellulosilyticum]